MAKQKKTLKRKVAHAAGWQVAKRMAKMVPFGGTAVAVVLVGTDVKNKGLFKGVVNSGLDAIPIVGLLKNGIEIVRGKDFIPDKEEKRNGSKG
jgi:hypothetical protein